MSVLYMPQALIPNLASDLGISTSGAGVVAAATQMGYAVGILCWVPLASIRTARGHITVQTGLLSAVILIAVTMQDQLGLSVAMATVGFLAAITQVVFTATIGLASPDRKGRTTSGLLAGVLLGAFGSRLLVAACEGLAGWRILLGSTAVLVLLPLPAVRRTLPPSERVWPRDAWRAAFGRYREVIGSLVHLATIVPSVGQALVFAVFNAMWAVSVLHLADAPNHWPTRAAASLGVVGLAAATLVPRVGHLIDSRGPLPVKRVLVSAVLVVVLLLALMSNSVAVLVVTLFVVTIGNQGSQSATQSSLLSNSDHPAATNAAFMFILFAGGASGTALGVQAYDSKGMAATLGLAVGAATVSTILAWTDRSRRDARNDALHEGGTVSLRGAACLPPGSSEP